MSDRGLGYLKDLPDARDFPAEVVFGAPVGAYLVPASMKQWCVGRTLQGGANSCVANALAKSIDMIFRRSGIVDPPFASRRFIYWNARRQEAREAAEQGAQPEPMSDRGCFPRLAMRAVQRLGFCPETEYPYSDAPSAIAETPPPLAYRAAIDQSGFQYGRVSSSGMARAIECAQALAAGCVPIFGTLIDQAFMRNQGEVITRLDMTDIVGGHMLAVVEVTHDHLTFANWWGGWGDAEGFGKMSLDLFGSTAVTDTYVLRTAPTFSTSPDVGQNDGSFEVR